MPKALMANACCGYVLAMTSGDAFEFRAALDIPPTGRADAVTILRVRSDAILAKAAMHCDAVILND